MADTVKLIVPDLGDFSDVEVIEVLVAPGDDVAVEDGLVTLETDKAAMDVPASHAGRIVTVEVSVGDTVSTGDVVATGTPPGVGMGQKPRIFLKPGDVMRLGVEGLGEQEQKLVADG